LPAPPPPAPSLPLRIEVFDPEGGLVASQTLPQDAHPPIKLAVTAELRGREWTCKVTNIHDVNVRASSTLVYTTETSFDLYPTLLPKRVLEQAASVAVAAVGLTVHLDGAYSYIDFSPDLKDLSGGALHRIDMSLSDVLNDVNLQSIKVTVPAVTDGGPAVLQVGLAIETEGVEIEHFAADVDLTTATATLELALAMDGPVGDRRLHITGRLDAELEGEASGLIGQFVDVSDYEDDIADIAGEVINDDAYMGAATEYLALILQGLAQRGDVLFDIRPSTHPNYPGIVVYHHDTQPSAYPVPPTLPRPLPLAVPAAPSGTEDNLGKFDHLVVLMQENRSFDQMLGFLRLRDHRAEVEGLSGIESNSMEGLGVVGVSALTHEVPVPSPHHSVDHVLQQINDGQMDGFLRDFVERFPNDNPRLVMGYYPPSELPTYDFLTDHYLVCDYWFCAFPGATQPNRFCTLGGYTPALDNLNADDPALGYLDQRTIFDALSEASVDWVYYEHDVAFLRMFDRYRIDDRNVVPIDDPVDGLQARVRAGTLPPVTFIDPNFRDIPPAILATDDTPPADVIGGQVMIADIYNTLFSSPLRDRILFVVTYDEHGGFFDHVAPPGTSVANQPVATLGGAVIAAAGATTGRQGGGDDQRSRVTARRVNLPGLDTHGFHPPPVHPDGPGHLGPRVPALVVSAYVEAETVSHTVFDHTSVIRTIALKWLQKEPLEFGPRPSSVNHLGSLLTRDEPRRNLPVMPVVEQRARIAKRRLRRQVESEGVDEFHEAMRRFGMPPDRRAAAAAPGTRRRQREG
jgi:phospholipase C